MTGVDRATLERLQDDPSFRGAVVRLAARLGPRMTAAEAARRRVIDDSSYFTAAEVDRLVTAGKLREAAELWGGLRLANTLTAAGALTDNGTAGPRCWHGAAPGARHTPCARCRRAWRRRELLLFIAGAECAAGRRLPLVPGDFDGRFRR